MTEELTKVDRIKEQVARMEEDHKAYVMRNDAKGKFLWQGTLPDTVAKMIAEMSVHYGLDPFMNHIQMLGGNIYISVQGLFHKINGLGIMKEIGAYPLTLKERDDMLPKIPEDMHAYKCILEMKDGGKFIEYGFASQNDVTQALKGKGYHAIAAMARTRAYGRAIRNALRINMPILEDMEATGGVLSGNVKEIVDGNKLFDIAAIEEPKEFKDINEEMKNPKSPIPEMTPEEIELEDKLSKAEGSPGNGKRNRRSHEELIKDWMKANVKEEDVPAFKLWLKSDVMKIAKEAVPTYGNYKTAWEFIKSNKDIKLWKSVNATPVQEPAKPVVVPEDSFKYQDKINGLIMDICKGDFTKVKKEIMNVSENKYDAITAIKPEDLKMIVERLEIRKAEINNNRKE